MGDEWDAARGKIRSERIMAQRDFLKFERDLLKWVSDEAQGKKHTASIPENLHPQSSERRGL